MAPVEVSPRRVSPRRRPMFPGCDADHSVVWLRGAHDASTVVALCMTIARAIAVDDTELVVDLSEVTFMDAATVGVMIRAEAFLRARSDPPQPSLGAPSAWAAWRISSIHGHQAGPGDGNRGRARWPGGRAGNRWSRPRCRGVRTRPGRPRGPCAFAEGWANRRTATTRQNTHHKRGRPEEALNCRQLRSAPFTAGPHPTTAHDSAVLATIAAAYHLAAMSGSFSLRSHDLLRQLHHSVSVLLEAAVGRHRRGGVGGRRGGRPCRLAVGGRRRLWCCWARRRCCANTRAATPGSCRCQPGPWPQWGGYRLPPFRRWRPVALTATACGGGVIVASTTRVNGYGEGWPSCHLCGWRPAWSYRAAADGGGASGG